jgi:hypothetical protein
MVLPDIGCRQEINKQNMNIELVAQMFKNYQSNVLFHLEGEFCAMSALRKGSANYSYNKIATDNLKDPA